MIDVIDNKYFYLHNKEVSYLFDLLPNQQLEHLYYGEDLGELSGEDLDYISLHPNKASGTVKYSKKIKNFTLADRMQEFPTYGTSDFREGTISIEYQDEYLYPDFKYDHFKITTGKRRSLDFPASYGKDSENLTIYLIDSERQLELQLSYSIFENLSAIVRKATIINRSKRDIKITNLQSAVLDLPSDNYDFLQLSGAWIKERHIVRRPLTQGIAKVESLRGASSHQENPFIALVDKDVTNDNGNIYSSNLIYSGNFISQVEVDEWGQSRLMTGINPATFTWKLSQNQVFSTPEAVLFYSNQGFNGLMKQTHNFVKKHIIDQKWQKQDRPIVVNNWEATYFDFNEAKLLNLAKEAKNLGIECFVLDDGWFGTRNSDNSSLGNWTVDKKKFPQGLDHFSTQVHKLGMKFGLWFEPEMVSADTDLYKFQPDWVVRHPYGRFSVGRSQYVLDFANPEVINNIYNQMEKVIEKAHVDYIKWDMNRNITEAYSPYLNKIGLGQGEFFHRYIQGVYKLYAKLLTRFPNLLIEGCASGGGRFDLGILFYSPQIWPSDDSDAVERLDIMSGTLLAYPLSTFSNHVSQVPNDQVKRITSLKFRQNLDCFGPLGYELDLNKLSLKEKIQIKDEIKWYKKNRKLLVNGNFDQLLKFDPSQNTYAWSVSDNNSQIIGFYRKLARPNETLDQYLPLKHLKFQQQYLINQTQIVSGKVLQSFGLREPYQFNASNPNTAQVSGDFQSYLYQIKAIDRKN